MVLRQRYNCRRKILYFPPSAANHNLASSACAHIAIANNAGGFMYRVQIDVEDQDEANRIAEYIKTCFVVEILVIPLEEEDAKEIS